MSKTSPNFFLLLLFIVIEIEGKCLWSKQPFNNLDLFLPSLIYRFAQLAILNEELLGFNSILAVWIWNSIRNTIGPRVTVVPALADSPL